jgi:tetratricopeptide (TPR) repeat protein
MAANEALWKHVIETEAKPIIPLLKQAADPESGGKERLRQWSQFRMPPPPLILALAKSYSCALNSWGVVLQKQKNLGAAAQCFSLASELNPDNHLARVNLQCNQDLQAGHPVAIAPGTPVEEGLRKYRDWYSVLADNGPCDEPGYLYRLAVFYQKEGLWRQTGQQLERALELAPSAADARLVLASVYLHCQLLDSALRTVQEIQAKPEWQPRIKHPELILGMLEAQILYAMANPSRADQVLRSLLETHPDDPDLVDLARSIFMAQRSYANAAWAADLRLQLTPDYIPALVDKGRSQVRSGAFSDAIPVLTQVLSLTNRFDARYLRAEAYANVGKLDAAADDYRQLLQEDPHSPEAYGGMAELARARGDTNEAIRYYQLCLTNIIPSSEAAKHATLRLRELIPR